ncbi:Na(+)-translocating NADH-quinone reductase subunit C [Neisseria sp. ZJ106]|uniref:Na(+)-translocating NADH-quinone reductase subunit C n=1 Tax=Neisseria lisongii TaxID=2912188 RepID=A0AAW5APB8_9NEIS|nr:Na(+)-translocating NADH-quinone reductase subunit C [Neisseria lisongii]MCF7521600.1 Na(+)-translocating NADH-quinone reductase subunit C [Neisseria lisongii]MCF7530286.1 Na(+)-translocating NADH-quinone reductase subunit C [Neisseria lisongii]WCL71798.1 Na(+)-translocating NADH-quinone reductase subunit C [Neisseria lisongii]
MAKKFDKDSFSGTLIVVLAVSLICSVIVAGAVVGLKPFQTAEKVKDKQSYILSVAGLLDENTDISKVYNERIEQRVVDLASGEYVADAPADFSARVAVKDPEQSIKINPEDDLAGLKTRAKYTEVYLVKDENGKVGQIVLPMHGNGLWSVMYGFVSIQPDGNTVNGITYYDQGETPGLGGEISNPLWQQKFVGKKLFDENGKLALHVGKGASADKEHGVDALSGASLTSKGVQGSFAYWFGENGYIPYLNKLKSAGVQ